jgi:peptidoglycan hydrolase-like protein with peptidoglycan-binding domain
MLSIFSTPLLGAAIGAGVGAARKRDVLTYAAWGAGLGLAVTLLGGLGVSVGRASIRVGAGGSTDIFRAQLMLGQLGYHVDADGVLGPKTVAALKSFQATYSLLRTDGSVNPETMAYLVQLVQQRNMPQINPDTGLHDQGIITPV